MIGRSILMSLVNFSLWLITIAVLLFLIFPLVVVIPESFSPSAILQFPPASLSLRWYEDFFGDPFWLQSLWLSIKLGIAVAIFSLTVRCPSSHRLTL